MFERGQHNAAASWEAKALAPVQHHRSISPAATQGALNLVGAAQKNSPPTKQNEPAKLWSELEQQTDEPLRIQQLAALTLTQHKQLLSYARRLAHPLSLAAQHVFGSWIEVIPDDQLKLMCEIASVRFATDIKSNNASVLLASWRAMTTLPPAMIEGNQKLTTIDLSYKDEQLPSYGDYNIPLQKASIHAGILSNEQAHLAEMGDPLAALNDLYEIVLHEIGHSVDHAIEGSKRYCLNNPAGGDWREYGNKHAVLQDMFAHTTGPLKSSPHAAKILKQLEGLSNGELVKVANMSGEFPAFNGKPTKQWLSISAAELDLLFQDPFFAALGGFADESWNREPVSLGGRVFQKQKRLDGDSFSVANSYAYEAREKKLSRYQFSSRMDWWAEAFAAYYGKPANDKGERGELLAQRDPATKLWFDQNVNNKPFAEKGGLFNPLRRLIG